MTIRIGLRVLTATVVFCSAATTATATTIDVTGFGDVLANNGLCALREAIINANNDDQSGSSDCAAGSGRDVIRVPAGVHTLLLVGAGEDAALTGDLDIVGPLTMRAQRPGAIIDASAIGDRVFDIHVAARIVRMDRLEVRGGNSLDSGGGVRIIDSTLQFRNGRIHTNTAGLNGGGVNVDGGQLHMSRSRVGNNTSLGDGGGIRAISGATVRMRNTDVVRNIALGAGGGIHTESTRVRIVNGAISGNTGNSGGGGLSVDLAPGDPPVRLFKLKLSDNRSVAGEGGGIRAIGRRLVEIRSCSILNNKAFLGGGGIYGNLEKLRVTNSNIRDNSANGSGGGINLVDTAIAIIETTTVEANRTTGLLAKGGGIRLDSGTDLAINNSSIVNNQTRNLGGGIFAVSSGIVGVVTLNNSTVSGNTADVDGGGIYAEVGVQNGAEVVLNSVTVGPNQSPATGGLVYDTTAGGSGSFELRNTIVAPQFGASCRGTFISQGFNIEPSTDCDLTDVSDQQNTDALLLGLAYGGSTPTHALDALSPAIDTASPLGCTADLDGNGILETLLTEDQRGNTREVDFPGVGNETPDHSCDVGAFELQ